MSVHFVVVYFLLFIFLDLLKYSRYFPCVTYSCRRLFSHAPGRFLSFVVQSSLHFIKSFLLTIGITSLVTGNKFRKSFQSCLGIPSHPVIFFSSFKCYVSVSVFTAVQGEGPGSSVILLHTDIQFSQHCLLKRLHFQRIFSHFCKKQK